MLGRQTFILLQKKTFRHTIKLYLRSSDEKHKVDQRNVQFTTEHKVSEKERNRNARKIAGEYSTSDEVLIDALYRDTGYGKTFVHVDDPEGKRKRESFNVTALDAKKIALKNLFMAAGIEFDGAKSAEVLTEEYQIFVSAKTGVAINKGTASQIHHEEKDVQLDLITQVASAQKAYQHKYGEPVPEEFKNDLGFLSALADPNWDAKAYIKEQQKSTIMSVETEGNLPNTPVELQKIYFEEFGVNVANPKKNDIGWMKTKIEENRAK